MVKAATDLMVLDLSAPEYKVAEKDRSGLPADQAAVRIFLSIHVLQTAVNAKFPAGMTAKDGKVWGRFLDLFAEQPEKVEIQESDFAWLYRIFTAWDLRLPTGIQGWKTTLEEYLTSLRLEHDLKIN